MRVLLVVCLAAASIVGCSSEELQPDEAIEIGEEYDFRLTTHCGVEWTRIDGFWWRTAPLDDGNANPPTGWDNPSQEGRLRITEADTAVFIGGPEPIEFTRTDISDPDDPALPDTVRSCD